MRKWFWLIALFGFACEDERDMDFTPSILLNISPQQSFYTFQDTLAIDFTLSAFEGLSQFQITYLNNNVNILSLGEDVLGQDVTYSSNFIFQPDSGFMVGDSVILQVSLKDKSDRQALLYPAFKVAEPISIDTIIFGDQTSAFFGNAISLSQMSTYNSDNSSAAANIDLLVYQDSILGGWLIFAPDVTTGLDSLYPELANYSIKNNTRMDVGFFNNDNFNSLQNDGPLLDSVLTPALEFVDSIPSSQIIYFELANSKKGLMRLSSFQIDNDSLGSFGIAEIRIQK